MGTNIYFLKTITPAHKYKMVKAVMDEDWETLKNLVPEKVHIGKFSAGWMFCFDHNDGMYYRKSREGLETFFSTGRLKDEYGRDVTDAEFWAKVADFSEGMWEATNPEDMWPNPSGEKEEIIDGLRWSAWTDFS